MKKRILYRVYYCLILLALLSLTGCVANEPPNSQGYFTFLNKAKDFMGFCLFIAQSDKPYWGQFFSRLYYSYFTMARMIHYVKSDKFEQEKHTVIWQQNKKKPRKIFGEELKHLRTYYDYDYDSFKESQEKLNEHLRFVLNNRKAFQDLIDDLKEQTKKFYNSSPNKEIWIDKCNKEIDEIVQIQNDIEQVVEQQLKK